MHGESIRLLWKEVGYITPDGNARRKSATLGIYWLSYWLVYLEEPEDGKARLRLSLLERCNMQYHKGIVDGSFDTRTGDT